MNWKLLLEALNSQTLCLSCYNKFKRGHFGVGGGVGGAKYLLVILQSKLTSVNLWSTMTCTVYGHK